MQRLYYLTEQLSCARSAADAAACCGVDGGHFHVLSHDEAGIKKHHLHAATPIHQLDIVRSGERGFIFGLVAAFFLISAMSQWTGWFDRFGLVAITGVAAISIGFFTWLGGLVGVQAEHYKIRRFHNAIERGAYLLMVDVGRKNRARVVDLLSRQAGLRPVGEGSSWSMPFDWLESGAQPH